MHQHALWKYCIAHKWGRMYIYGIHTYQTNTYIYTHIYRQFSVFTTSVGLAAFAPTVWLGSIKVGCKELYHINIFICTASLVARHGEGGGGKGAPGVYCMRMRVNFQKFLENHITSRHLRYTDFCEVVDFYCVEDAYQDVYMLCVNDDEGAMKALSFSVARMIHAFVHSS